MKYRTIIELICDAADKEDALNTAGEYLRGEVESGVDMRCKAVTVKTHKVKRIGFLMVIVLVLASSVFAGVSTREKNKSLKQISSMILSNTCTIQPALKTKYKGDFAAKWEKKKDEAILSYIKK